MISATSAGTLAAYLASREALVARASGGTADARALADLTDDAVPALAGAASSNARTRFCLFALGGYGARRLLPASDIDLLFVSRGTTRELEPLVRAVAYPLWDAGLAVGYQVRSPKQQVRAMADDLEVLTSFLTARYVCGDKELADETLELAFRRIGRDDRRHLATIAARERPDSPYLLEPDLKNGAGGQRDLDELVWRAAVATAAPAHDAWPLVSAGVLDVEGAAALFDAQDAITRARWKLHAFAGRARNTMTVDDADVAGVDAERVQRALESVHHALTEVRSGPSVADGASEEPLTAGEIAALGAGGADALPALERAARLGLLDRAVPDFSGLMTLRRPALSHRFTVGAHCLRTLVFALGADPAMPHATLDPEAGDALLVAALAHDVGKREPGPGHAARGAAQAPDTARRLGLDDATGAMATVLVREHLLLADVATRADLDDEDVVLGAAARIGDARLVGALHRLTAADMRATGPDVWTPWRAALVGELASKLADALSPAVDGAGIAPAAERVRALAMREASALGASAAQLDFIEHAPLRYLARRGHADVLRDARLVAGLRAPSGGDGFALGVRPGAAPGTWTVDVVARERAGLVVTIAGVLALCGLDVLAADIHTHRGAIAVDSFTVASATLAAVEHATWASVERLLGVALAGRLDLETRLAERRRHYERTPARAPSRPRGRSARASRSALPTASDSSTTWPARSRRPVSASGAPWSRRRAASPSTCSKSWMPQAGLSMLKNARGSFRCWQLLLRAYRLRDRRAL